MPPTPSPRAVLAARCPAPCTALRTAALAAAALSAAACVVTPLSVARRQDATRAAARTAPHADAPAATPARAARPASAAPQPAPFAWPGTYDLVGSDFPDGDRRATLTVTRRGDGYALALDGPPGWAAESHVGGDSARVVWEFGGGGPPMFVWLRGRADSLSGTWAIGAALGPIRGSRRPQ